MPAFQSVFSTKRRNYLKVCICWNSCEDTLLQYYKMLFCYLYRIQADNIDCVILATTSVLYYKCLTRIVLTKENETGSEEENILLSSRSYRIFIYPVTSVDSWMIPFGYMRTPKITEIKVLGEYYLYSILFEKTLYLMAITINTISRGTIVILSE